MIRTVSCVLAAAVLLACTRPGLFAADPATPTVLIEVRVVQLNPNAATDARTHAAREDAVVPRMQRDADTGHAVPFAPRGRNLLLCNHILPFRPPCETRPASASTSSGTPVTVARPVAGDESVWTETAVPRIVAFTGQTATVQIGAPVPYMVKRPDGSLVVEYGESEGLSLEVRASEATPTGVRLDQMELKLSRVISRAPIPDVPFDVGKPGFSTFTLSTPQLWLPADQVAVFALSTSAKGPADVLDATSEAAPASDDRPIFALVSARLIDKQP